MSPDGADDRPLAPLLPGLGLLLAVALALAGTRPVTPPTMAPALWAGICAIYCMAEALSPGLNGFARFPLSVAPFLVALACPGSGRGGWIVLALTGCLIRFLRLRGKPWLGCLADATPEFAAAAAFTLVPVDPVWGVWLASLAYLLAWRLAPSLYSPCLLRPLTSAWLEAHQRSLTVLGFLTILGAAVCSAFSEQPVAMLALLVGSLLLSLPVRASMDALLAVGLEEERLRQASFRASELASLEQRSRQIDAMEQDARLQLKSLSLVGELFRESSRAQNPGHLRASLLNSVRNLVSCDWVGLYKIEPTQCSLSASLGDSGQQPASLQVAELAGDKARPTRRQVRSSFHMGLPFSDHGLIVLRREADAFQDEEAESLQRLAAHLPLCLEVIRYQESQSKALGGEQQRRNELNRLATRLSATLDVLARLVGCRGVEELIATAQRSLPDLIPQYQAEVQWRGKLYRPAGGLSLACPAREESWELPSSRYGVGHLRLYTMVGQPLGDLDRELLRLFSSQFACLLETAGLHDDLNLTLEQLKRSQAQLVQNSKLAAIGQLAAGVAHELNTPLGAVTVGSELVRKFLESDQAKAKERIEGVLVAASQMQEVISKLLLYSNTAASSRHPVDLGQLVKDTLLLIPDRGCVIEVSETTPVRVWGSPGELQQVVRSLVLNALESQSSRLEISLEVLEGKVALHVKDEGIGMDEVTSQRVYEPFFTTKSVGQGTGLGLSTARQLVEQHNGQLSHVSQPGQGSTFTVTLPLGKEVS